MLLNRQGTRWGRLPGTEKKGKIPNLVFRVSQPGEPDACHSQFARSKPILGKFLALDYLRIHAPGHHAQLHGPGFAEPGRETNQN